MSLIKNLALLAIGAAIGSLVTYRVVKNQLVEEDFSEETEMTDEEYEGDVPDEKDPPIPFRYQKVARKHTDYSAVSRKDSEPNDQPKTASPPDPYVIDHDTFHEEMSGYEKITLNYYRENDVLTDDQDEVISDMVDIIGKDALANFGYNSDDPDIVYVRNEKYESDYEVVRLHERYEGAES